MVSPNPNVNRILQEAQSLSEPELQELRHLLDQRPALSSKKQENELDQLMRDRGVIRTLPKRSPQALARFKAWRPIEMPGDSLSDELIRDRR